MNKRINSGHKHPLNKYIGHIQVKLILLLQILASNTIIISAVYNEPMNCKITLKGRYESKLFALKLEKYIQSTHPSVASILPLPKILDMMLVSNESIIVVN